MANCPNCKHRLSFFKVGFLSRLRDKVKCNSCNKISEADKSLIGQLGGLGAGLGSIVLLWNKEIFGNHPSSIILGIVSAVLLIFIVALIQNKYVKLTIAEDQNNALFEEEEIKIIARPPLPKNASRIEYLKNIYYSKSDAELEFIAKASENEMTKEAQEAAKELLEERKV